MQADRRFLEKSKEFWANVRTISQEIGYTEHGKKSIKIPTLEQVCKEFSRLKLSTTHILDKSGTLTKFGKDLFDYFKFRADILNGQVQNFLMDKSAAGKAFHELRATLNPHCPLPMNKQKGEKKQFAFLTGMVNMLIEANISGTPCDYDPRSLTTMTQNELPLRTLSRRVDGAYPSVINPIAIWEIKEYYYTTTFGSRVADGVYETLLDGLELEELNEVTKNKVQHILFIDDRYTWWDCGRSYLCRIIDMLHMGYVDEVVVGREVIKRLPELAKEWKVIFDTQPAHKIPDSKPSS